MSGTSRDVDGGPATSTTVRVKLGTQPATVYLHPDDPVVAHTLIRYKGWPWEPWERWSMAWVHEAGLVPVLERM